MTYPQHHQGGMPIQMAPPGVAPHSNVPGSANSGGYPMISPQAAAASAAAAAGQGASQQTMAMQHHLLSMQQYMNTQSMTS